MAVTISQVLFEHHWPQALGIGETQPRISWRFAGDAVNWTQAGYSIEITKDNAIPEIFSIEASSESVLIPWPTVALKAAEHASVRVQAFGEGEEQPDTPWSEPYSVEAGLLSEEDWQGAQMIASLVSKGGDGSHEAPAKQPELFRKTFATDQSGDRNAEHQGVQSPKITRARLYITAYGVYEAYLNGKRVTQNVLAPGWQSYQHRHVFDTYDVTQHIQEGKNGFGIVVGEGWYAGRLGFDGGWRNIWGSRLGALAVLTITYDDGSEQVVKTDDSWTSGTGPIITSEIYDGEVYDARLLDPKWSMPDGQSGPQVKGWGAVEAIQAPFNKLVAPDGPPVQRTEEVGLTQILTSPSGKTVLDFGQNMVGWLRVEVDGPPGHEITFRHAEVLYNGEIATEPLRTAKQTDTIILAGNGTLVWEPSFTYHGFRYVEVTQWPINTTTPLNSHSVRGVVIHSAMERTGSLSCSDPLLTKLHENIVWSMRGNFISVPTDCPQRDERLGWSGDAHVFGPTANFLYDTSGFWRGWLKDVASEAAERNGGPPYVTPYFDQVTLSGAPAVWSDVITALPWQSFLTTGDATVLSEQYPAAKARIDTSINRKEPRGLWSPDAFQFGDWLDPLSPENDAGAATTNSTYVADAYLVGMTKLVSQMAGLLGKNDDELYYRTWADDLQGKFQDAWISPESGLVWNETQTGLVLPLYFDLFRNTTEAESAAKRLGKLIQMNGFKVGTGFAGTHLLGLALTQQNLTAEFYAMLKQTSVPSWLFQVLMGGTTTWERWDSMRADGTINVGGMTSFNHYAFGSVGNWMHRVIGGLSPAEPGWKRVFVRPEPGGDITSAKANYLSPYGNIAVAWEVGHDGRFHLKVVVPPNTIAEVVLPGRTGEIHRIGSGSHEFTT